MKLLEHIRDCKMSYLKPYSFCKQYPDCAGCQYLMCDENCPRCLIDKALVEQKAEMIAEVERKRNLTQKEIDRLEVEAGDIQTKQWVVELIRQELAVKYAQVSVLYELLKGWGEG